MSKKSKQALKILEGLLKHVTPWEDHENLAGDFAEMFARKSHDQGKTRALFWYAYQILKLMPAYLKNYTCWSLTMIKNYLKIAVRNLKKYKAYSFINIFGLTMGMACCILIMLYVQDELSYDRYHEKADRIFRLVDSFDNQGELSRDFALSSAPFAPTLKRDFPEVEDAVRIFMGRRRMVSYQEKKFYEDNLFFVDASIFKIFTFPLLKGDPLTALQAPNTIVISQHIAARYFGGDEALNKTLKINDQDFLVTGIMQEMPKNSHFYANMFASLKTQEQIPSIQERYFRSWARHEFYTYLLLQEGYDYKKLEAKLPGFIEKYAAPQIKTILGSTLSSQLQPLTSIHLHSHRQMEISPTSDIKNIYIFSVIALFILIIACVNFMNLATARAVNRSREVGLRKVVGANRYQLIQQFLGEALLFTMVAMILAMVLVYVTLPLFNSLTGKSLTADYFHNLILLGSILVILLFVGITSGSYPAFVISRYQPANVLKRFNKVGSSKNFLRKGLVILQFSISVILIISTIVVLIQLDFLRNKKLGFNKEHVVVVPIRSHSIRKNYEAVKAELQQNPNIINSTITIGVPGGVVAGDAIQLITKDGKKTITLRMIYTDHDYIKTMGMEILAGRDFSQAMSTDLNEAFIINEAAVRQLQLEDPLSTQFEWGEKKGKVIGVIKDYQFQSLKEEINPLVIHIWPYNTFVFAIRISPENIPATLSFIENTWKKLDPAHPFEYTFMDETFDKLYRSEEKLSQIFSVFSILAVFIASLGLFGLALYMVEQRTKEIGIRKILGASLGKIFILLSKEFAVLVLIANLAAWPTAYLLMRQWLQNFAYRIDIPAWIFISSAGIAFVIALLTISYQAIKAAMANPIDSLRYE